MNKQGNTDKLRRKEKLCLSFHPADWHCSSPFLIVNCFVQLRREIKEFSVLTCICLSDRRKWACFFLAWQLLRAQYNGSDTNKYTQLTILETSYKHCAVNTVHHLALFLPPFSLIPSIFLQCPPTPTELGEAHFVQGGEDSPSDSSARQIAWAL